VNFWLVAITWLQHTHHDLPHYGEEDFTRVKGAFGTVDRHWGWLLDTLHHKITSTHVAHHVCEQIPHYRAEQATEALRQRFPALCKRDDTPFLQALWHVTTECVLVQRVPGTRTRTSTCDAVQAGTATVSDSERHQPPRGRHAKAA